MLFSLTPITVFNLLAIHRIHFPVQATGSGILEQGPPFTPRPQDAAGAGTSALGTPNAGGRAPGRAALAGISSKSPPPWMPGTTSSGTLHLLPWHQAPRKGGAGSRVAYIVLED